MIVLRYIFKELIFTTLVALCLLLVLLISNQLIILLTKTAGGLAGFGMIFQLIALSLPQFLGLLLPLSLFLSVIWVYGRLWADQEMVILMSYGLTYKRLLLIALVPAFVLIPIVALCTLYLGPMASNSYDHLMSHVRLASIMQAITPGRFHSVDGGRTVVYVQKHNPGDELKNIFIVRSAHRKNETMVLYSKNGRIKKSPHAGDYMVLEDGYRYNGRPGSRNYQVMHYKQYWMKLADLSHVKRSHARSLTTAQLWQEKTPRNYAQLAWRSGFIIMVPLLVLLALVLSPVRPRRSRYSRLLPAFIVLLTYYNLLLLSKAWIEDGVIRWSVGMGLVHGLFAAVILAAIFHQQRRV